MARKVGERNKSFILLFILLVILLLGYTLVKARVFLASLALTPDMVGDVIVISEPLDGGLTKVELRFRTGTNKENVEPISTLSMKLSVSSADLGDIKLVTYEGNEVNEITPNEELVNLSEWKFSVNTVERKEKEIVINFAGTDVTKDGFASDTYKTVASFYLSGVKAKENLQFTFDEPFSQMFSKRRPVTDIWE